VFVGVSAKDSSVSDETRTFYSQCGSTLDHVIALHLRQTQASSLKYVDTNHVIMICCFGYLVVLAQVELLQITLFQ